MCHVWEWVYCIACQILACASNVIVDHNYPIARDGEDEVDASMCPAHALNVGCVHHAENMLKSTKKQRLAGVQPQGNEDG